MIADNTSQVNKTTNLALEKSILLKRDTLITSKDESLSPLGTEPDPEDYENSTDSRDCPSDEGGHEMLHGEHEESVEKVGTMQDVNCCNESPLHGHGQNDSIQNVKQSDSECETIEQVSRLLGEMADILDESVCSSTSTWCNDNHQESSDGSDNPDNSIPPLAPATSNAAEQPKIPINLTLLRQMAIINTNLRDVAGDATGDGQGTLVEGNMLTETIEILLAERIEIFQEVLSLLEAAREETRELRDLSERNGNCGVRRGAGGGNSPSSTVGINANSKN